MSNPSLPNKSENPRANHYQSETVPFSNVSAHQLAQFSAAAAANYYPKAQTTPGSFATGSTTNPVAVSQPVLPTTSTTTTTTVATSKPTTVPAAPTKLLSEFAKSAYETAGQGGTSGLQPPPAQLIDLTTFKGLKFVTLDGLQLETREIYDKISGTYQWEMCESQDDRCMQYVREQCANKRVFLVSSGSLGRRVVPTIHDLPQIYAIYVYCADVPYNQEWANKYNKVRVVCNDDDKYLLPQLAVDVAQANIDWADALLKGGKRDKAQEKYQKALDNLNVYAKRPDPEMIKRVEAKLAESK